MVSDRARTPRGIAAIAAAAGLIAAGAVIMWALRHGFYGTTLFAGLLAIWLTTLLWWTASEPRDAAVTAGERDQDHEDERVMLRTLLDQAPGALLALEGTRVRALNRAARHRRDRRVGGTDCGGRGDPVGAAP